MTKEEIAAEHTILRTVVGSQVHGLAIEGTDDRDEMGVCIEPPEYVCGLRQFEQYTYRTQPEGVRSGPGDLDLVVYGLRKYMGLVIKGNPTVLLPIFAPQEATLTQTPLGEELRYLVPRLLSRESGFRFLGYLKAQRERVEGFRGQAKLPSRPELVEAHGYDTKYAGHMIRLGMQGVELLFSGRITLPVPEPARSFILSVRRGEVSKEEALAKVNYLEQLLVKLVDQPGPLLDKPDYDMANTWLVSAHQRHWSEDIDRGSS